MKKIALCSLMCCLYGLYAVTSFAGTCGPVVVTFDSLFTHSSKENWFNNTLNQQHYDDDEFLYDNAAEYEKTKNGYRNSNGHNSGDGRVWECDDMGSSSCTVGDIADMPANHYFKGKLVKEAKKYKCFGEDAWYEYVDPEKFCSTNQWGKLKVGETKKDLTTYQCSGMRTTEEQKSLVTKWEVSCVSENNVICRPQECIKDYTVSSDGKCVPNSNISKQCDENGNKYNVGQEIASVNCSQTPNGNNYTDLKTGKICKKMCLEDVASGDVKKIWSISECPKNMHGVPLANPNKYNPAATGYKKCVANGGGGNTNTACDKFKAYPERYACCMAGTATEWFVIGSTAEKSTNPASGECKCVDSAGNVDAMQEWVFDSSNKTGYCRAKTISQTTPITNNRCTFTFKEQFKCPNGDTVNANIRYENIDPNTFGRNNCDGFEDYVRGYSNVMDALQKAYCKENGKDVVKKQGPDDETVKKAKGNLDEFFRWAKSDANVWKDSEGKFNTTRLASDLTASAVLGTVGGVVSGVVIKKKQVEKGFEALHCTVGDRQVAGWGDEFRVEFRR